VQHSLPGSISLEVAYAGSKGTHLQGVKDPNQVQVPAPPGDVQPRRPLPQLRRIHRDTNIANSTIIHYRSKPRNIPITGSTF